MRSFTGDPDTGATTIRCLWCDRPTVRWDRRTFQSVVCVCDCGALAMFAPPHDFDEAGEELLHHLGLPGEVAEPLQPVGNSGMLHARYYDADRARADLVAALAAAGHTARTEDITMTWRSAQWPTSPAWTAWGVWWRPAAG